MSITRNAITTAPGEPHDDRGTSGTVVQPALCPGRGADAATILTFYLVLLICIPTSLIFAPIGTVATPANGVAVLAAMLWIFGRAAPQLALATGRQPVRPLLVIFGLSILASYVVASTIPLSDVEMRSADGRLIQLVCWSGIIVLAADGIPDRMRLDKMLRRWVLLGSVLGLIAILQFLWAIDVAAWIRIPGLSISEPLSNAVNIQYRYGVRRVTGTATHPIELGVVLALLLPLALHFAIEAPRGRRLRHWLQVSFVGLGALMSVSRSATLGIAVGMVTVMAGWPLKYIRRAVLLSPLLIVVLRIVAPGVLGTLRGLFTNVDDDPSVTGRTDDYSLIMPFVRDHPVLGRGFGAFIPQLYVLPGGRSGGSLILDNEYLNTLIQKGAVGVAALILLLVGTYFVGRSARRAAVDHSTRDLAQALCAMILVPTVTFTTFDGLSFPMIAGLTFLTIGTIGSLWRLTRNDTTASSDGVVNPRVHQ